MTAPDRYPSVTIVAGDIQAVPPAGSFSPMLRMHGGSLYIHIDPATAWQWIGVLQTIATTGKSK